MNEHYIVTIDRGHLRIYAETKPAGQPAPRLEVVEAMDFPSGKTSCTANDTDMAGRFPGSDAEGRDGGTSIDERLPMTREEERRMVRQIAGEVEKFLSVRPRASWDLAAAPSLYNPIIGELSSDTCRRLKRALSQDLVNQNTAEVRAHFATSDGR